MSIHSNRGENHTLSWILAAHWVWKYGKQSCVERTSVDHQHWKYRHPVAPLLDHETNLPVKNKLSESKIAEVLSNFLIVVKVILEYILDDDRVSSANNQWLTRNLCLNAFFDSKLLDIAKYLKMDSNQFNLDSSHPTVSRSYKQDDKACPHFESWSSYLEELATIQAISLHFSTFQVDAWHERQRSP